MWNVHDIAGLVTVCWMDWVGNSKTSSELHEAHALSCQLPPPPNKAAGISPFAQVPSGSSNNKRKQTTMSSKILFCYKAPIIGLSTLESHWFELQPLTRTLNSCTASVGYNSDDSQSKPYLSILSILKASLLVQSSMRDFNPSPTLTVIIPSNTVRYNTV